MSCVHTSFSFLSQPMTIIFILTLLALVLALIEILIVPGFGIAGLASMALALADVVVIYLELGPWWAMAAVGIGILVILITMRWLTRSKAIDRMSLHARIDSTNATTAQLSVKVGDTGKALTRLALVGNAEINGLVVEVKSSGAFLNPGTPLRVIHVSEANITVEAIQQ